MKVAKQYIDDFNNLNGKTVHPGHIRAFLNEVKAANNPVLKQLEEKLLFISSKMVGYKPVKLSISKKLELKPIPKTKAIANTKVAKAPKVKREKKRSLPPVKRVASNKVTKEPLKKSKVKALNGVVDANAIAQLNFTKLPITGKYKDVFGSLYSDTQMMFWGLPGSGKTVYLLLFAQYLAESLCLKVLYLANEEMNRSTLTEKIREFKIGNKNLSFAKDLNALKTSGLTVNDFDVVFFDSVQSLGMDLKGYKKFVEEHPGILYVLVIQSTKDGDFKGGKDWEHEVDIAGEFLNRELVLRKNRLDSSFLSRREDYLINEKVSEGRKKALIRDRVKARNTEGGTSTEYNNDPVIPNLLPK